jgi:hypothetical protein
VSDDVHKILLSAFWEFNKHPPQFITCAKPQNQQFDSSDVNDKEQPNNAASNKKQMLK